MQQINCRTLLLDYGRIFMRFRYPTDDAGAVKVRTQQYIATWVSRTPTTYILYGNR